MRVLLFLLLLTPQAWAQKRPPYREPDTGLELPSEIKTKACDWHRGAPEVEMGDVIFGYHGSHREELTFYILNAEETAKNLEDDTFQTHWSLSNAVIGYNPMWSPKRLSSGLFQVPKGPKGLEAIYSISKTRCTGILLLLHKHRLFKVRITAGNNAQPLVREFLSRLNWRTK